jgi:lysyl endopeptidase
MAVFRAHPLRRLAWAILALALLPQAASAGRYQTGDQPLIDDVRTLGSLPMRAVSPAAAAKALASLPTGKGRPLAIAAGLPLAASLDDGRWDSPEPGIARWRMQVYSPGAKTLALEFSRFSLPADAALWLYDLSGQLIQGPYTAADQTPEGKLWTAMVPSDTVVLELRVPQAAQKSASLQLGQVQHGAVTIAKAFTGSTSGACNVDVACTAGDSWRDEIRAVGRYTVTVPDTATTSTVYLCTGQLVNNVRQDSTPYFLTANHCDTRLAPSSVVVYWNYQNTSCGGGTNNLSQNQSGATLKAYDGQSDFTLLQLNQTPPSAYNVYYTGWDASGSTPTSGVDIHHPEGDVKKISTFTTPASQAEVTISTNTSQTVSAWAVQWSQGTTEEGSSGSGLLNQNHQLVGVLSGGNGACSSSNPSVNNGGTDYFGRTAVAWQANVCSAGGQLKVWLDPDGSGITSLCGQNPGAPCNTQQRTTGTETPGLLPSSCSNSGGVISVGTPANTGSGNGGGGGGAPGLALLLPLLIAGRLARLRRH